MVVVGSAETGLAGSGLGSRSIVAEDNLLVLPSTRSDDRGGCIALHWQWYGLTTLRALRIASNPSTGTLVTR